jgi:hypothetical protein
MNCNSQFSKHGFRISLGTVHLIAVLKKEAPQIYGRANVMQRIAH